MRLTRRALFRQVGAQTAVAIAAPAMASALPASSTRPRGAPIRLSANENPYGPSPGVLALMRELDVSAACRYPDVELDTLRRSIARHHGVDRERIVLGSGSGEILRAIADVFLAPGSVLVQANPGCPAVRTHAIRLGAAVAAVPLGADWSHDLDRMLARACAAPALVYICNPNNPTGTLTSRRAIERFIRSLPHDAHVVIDEAYHEYVGTAADYASFIDEPVDDPRVIVTRSFSKAHGLAGMRVGYAIASPPVARRIASRGIEETIAAPAAMAAAAAFADRDHIRSIAQRNLDDRQEFANQANARMLRVIDSHTNFVMLNAQRPAGPIVQHFDRNGIALPLPFAPLNEYIRVSLGTRADMDEFWRIWDAMGMKM
jgi:histidinol-phosphate aminotransferase